VFLATISPELNRKIQNPSPNVDQSGEPKGLDRALARKARQAASSRFCLVIPECFCQEPTRETEQHGGERHGATRSGWEGSMAQRNRSTNVRQCHEHHPAARICASLRAMTRSSGRGTVLASGSEGYPADRRPQRLISELECRSSPLHLSTLNLTVTGFGPNPSASLGC